MRKSRVLERLRAGGIATCFKVNLCDESVVEIAGMAGFDCVWTDIEHVPNDWSVIKRQVLAGKTQDADLMVRVPRGSYSDYIKPLELDAAGIMVPHVMSLEQAEQIVRMTRFHPRGRRPIDGGNADGAYCKMDVEEYIEHGNRDKFITLQIEDPEPLDELDSIAALEGIDMLFFGAHDFSHGIGAPGKSGHPGVLEARRRVAEAAVKNGKFAGAVAGSGNVEELISMGYRFLSMGADVAGLWNYCEGVMDVFKKFV